MLVIQVLSAWYKLESSGKMDLSWEDSSIRLPVRGLWGTVLISYSKAECVEVRKGLFFHPTLGQMITMEP